ncbi:hypothetical protein FB45DRAFT_737562, partial [Roridomyces roridus]
MEAKLEGASFVGVKKLENGGVVYDCKSEEMAGWIKRDNHMKQFLAALGGSYSYRPRRQELLVERVDIGTKADDSGTWRLVEKDSGLEDGSIIGARWVKPPHQRSPTQSVAHLRVEFAQDEAANHAIDNGLFFNGRHHRARKTEDEPRRCAKCQQYGKHLARDCKAEADVCGRCAGGHRTKECTVTDLRTGAKCANCKVSGHGAVDRSCPVFQREMQKMKERDPTAAYRYFPTADSRTW